MRVLLWYLCCLLNSSKIKPSEARCKSYIDLNKKYIANLYKFIVKFIFCTTAENWCKWGTKCWPPVFYSLFYLTKIVYTFNLFLFIWKKYILLHTLSIRIFLKKMVRTFFSFSGKTIQYLLTLNNKLIII